MNNLLLNWTAINDWFGASNIKSNMHGSSQPVLCKNPTSPLLPPHNPSPPPPPRHHHPTHTLSLSPHLSTYTHSPVFISSLLLTTTGPFSPLPSLLAFLFISSTQVGCSWIFESLQATVSFWKLHSFCFLVHEFWLQTFAGWWWWCWGFFISCVGEKLRFLFKGVCVLLISPQFFFLVLGVHSSCSKQPWQQAIVWHLWHCYLLFSWWLDLSLSFSQLWSYIPAFKILFTGLIFFLAPIGETDIMVMLLQ